MAAPGIDSLPDSGWEIVLFALLLKARGDPSDAFRLSVASRALRITIGRLRFWLERCCLQGWLPSPGGQLAQHAAAGDPGSPAGQPSGALATSGPYVLFQQRMQTRWSVRRAFRQLEAFLRNGGFNAGASAEALSAAEEDRLGAPLPWQLWELYRFRDGQYTGGGRYGPGNSAWSQMWSITPMANGGRMLSLEEAVGAARAAGFGLQSLQMRTLCDQALTMGGSTARAAGAGVMHAAMAAGGSAVAAQGGSSTAAASGAGGLQALQPAEACRAPAPGGQAAEAAGEGPPSQFWLVPEPGVDVCNHFEDTPATGGLMEGCKGRRTRATLLPLTDEFSMNRQYLCDRTGRVFLRVGVMAGFQLMPAADTIVAFLNGLLR